MDLEKLCSNSHVIQGSDVNPALLRPVPFHPSLQSSSLLGLTLPACPSSEQERTDALGGDREYEKPYCSGAGHWPV